MYVIYANGIGSLISTQTLGQINLYCMGQIYFHRGIHISTLGKNITMVEKNIYLGHFLLQRK